MAGIMDVKRLIQEMIVPDLQQIKSDLATIKVEIRRLDEKIDGVDKRLSDKVDSLRSEFSAKLESVERGLSMAIDIHERLASLEAKIGH